MDRREPHIHKVWTFGEDGVTREVYPTVQVDVGTGCVVEFATNYLTQSWRRVPMFSVNSINGSVQWLDVLDLLRTDGPLWTGNVLSPIPAWGIGGTAKNPNRLNQPVVSYDSVSVPFSGVVCDKCSYITP